MGEIVVGETAPDFDVPTDGGGRVRLSDLKGQTVVLYFYPADDTAGCTIEATAFTALAPEFAALSARILGISPDTVRSHDKFKAKHNLTIQLASDADKTVTTRYGVWVKKSRFGRDYMGVERTTFLVGRDGRIAQTWRKVSAQGHAETVLEAIRQLA